MTAHRTTLGVKGKHANRNLRTRARLCVVCGESKIWMEFQPRRRSPVLNIYCNDCGKNPRRVRESLQPEHVVADKTHRRAAIKFLRELARRRLSKGRRLKGMKGNSNDGDDNKSDGKRAEEYALKVAKLPDRVAAIIGKTGAEMGDAATLADDEALMMIRDLLFEIDDTLMERNKNKRLAKR